MQPDELPRIAYEEYAKVVIQDCYPGTETPPWEILDPTIQAAWRAAVHALLDCAERILNVSN